MNYTIVRHKRDHDHIIDLWQVDASRDSAIFGKIQISVHKPTGKIIVYAPMFVPRAVLHEFMMHNEGTIQNFIEEKGITNGNQATHQA